MPAAKSNAANEPLVTHSTPMPEGYLFVAKGNVYITKNCRKNTQAAHKPVFVVVESLKAKRFKTLGIRVPANIYRDVAESERQTRITRAVNVQKRDDAGLRAFELELRLLFPKIPADVADAVARHALVKRSRRVGRSATMDMNKKVRLAVTAHIRHRQTDYDALLARGVARDEARAKVWGRIVEVADGWAGRPGSLRSHEAVARKEKKRARRRGDAVPTGKSSSTSPAAGGTGRGKAEKKTGGGSAKINNKNQNNHSKGKPLQAARALPDRGAKNNNLKLALRPMARSSRKPLPQIRRHGGGTKQPTGHFHGSGSDPFVISDDDCPNPNADFDGTSADDEDDCCTDSDLYDSEDSNYYDETD